MRRTPSRRLRRIVVFFGFFCLGYLACDIVIYRDIYFGRDIPILNPYAPELAEWNPEGQSEFILETPSCRIPRTPILPNYFKGKWKTQGIPDCSYEKTLGKMSSNGTSFQLLPVYHNQNCTASRVVQAPKNDNSFRLSNWTHLKNEMYLGNWEFFVIKCGISLNFEARFPISTQVKKKLTFWHNEFSSPLPKLPRPRPINVILLGIDSTSRSDAVRGLPKTIALFQEMGFHDFQGYHSISPHRLPNFMGFLMGLNQSTARGTCSPNSEIPFDSCPLIWKEYSAQNYVTMYLEHGVQTFNWGGASGLKDGTTDYYPHPLFTAIRRVRSKIPKAKGRKWKHVDCTSSETVPEFVGRYTKELIQTFSDIPFFAFTWYEHPFHDHDVTLQTLDNQLVHFYEFLNSTQHLLQNSLLIFLSDHGNRRKFFKQAAEGFIERGLPPLFIRIPEKLDQMYPGMRLKEVMEGNRHRLVSAFDLHHTLLHLLTLTRRKSGIDDFQPVMGHRRSLFVSTADRNGTCENLNIESDACVCNTLSKTEVFPFHLYMKNIDEILEKALNDLVESNGYKDKCQDWRVHLAGISNRVFRKTKSSLEILIRFRAEPGDAHFEVKLGVSLQPIPKESVSRWKILGDIFRISTYGQQSACLPSVTDVDKRMKEFCYCKTQTDTE